MFLYQPFEQNNNVARRAMWQHSAENKRKRHAAKAVDIPPSPVATPVEVPVAQAPITQIETPTFEGLEGAELVRAVCAWLMATAPKTGNDAESRLEAGEERVARLVHTVAVAGLTEGNGETEKYVDNFCGFLQARYFDGITTDEHGAKARSRAREGNSLIERLCSEQKFDEMAKRLPLPAHCRRASVESDLEEVGPGQQEQPERTQALEELKDLEDLDGVEESEVLEEEEEMEQEDEDEDEDEGGAKDDEELDEMPSEVLEKRVQTENQLGRTAYEGDEQNQARLMRHRQQRLKQQHQQEQEARLAAAVWRRQQQQEAAEAEAFSRQQQRRRSDPFVAYNLITPRQQRQHRPLFSVPDSPLGGWVSQPRRRRPAQPWTTSGFGGLASPMMLF